jgi:hypothetical protein
MSSAEKAVIAARLLRFVLSRNAALQPQNFAAPLINDRFSRGIAAVAGALLHKS